MSKRIHSQSLVLGTILGACLGAFAVGYWATQEYHLYSYQIPPMETFQGMTPLERIASLSSLHKVYNWPVIVSWGGAGAGIGGIGGFASCQLLRLLNNVRKDE